MDWVFAKAIQRLGQCDDPWVGLAAALVSRAVADGHVCLDLDQALASDFPEIDTAVYGALINATQWQERLINCAAIGAPGDFRPLIVDGGRLYLHRYWTYEHELAQAILQRCAEPVMSADDPRLVDALQHLFTDGDSDQKQAARLAATQRFSVISGGPGTGKTYTVARIIRLLQAIHPPESALKISLAAPTGKAAARLQESVQTLLATGPEMEAAAPAQVREAQTLHRLLGYMPGRAHFKYNSENPLPVDMVIVDEASMIDLAMMYRLINSLARQSRLVLVGDKDQLASVEAGAVLGEICHGISHAAQVQSSAAGNCTIEARRSLREHIVVLDRSYRFDAQSSIGRLSRAINIGDTAQVIALLTKDETAAVGMDALTTVREMTDALEAQVVTALGPLFDSSEPGAGFEALGRFKILCAVRQGPYGVEALNGYVEQALRKHGRIPPSAPGIPSQWYPGRPVMVLRNDYYQGLFNGDVGIAVNVGTGAEQSLRVAFTDSQGGFKLLAPHQLPEHQTVYAMTVHKSQGSEFERVVLVLPDRDVPVLTRELIYTAVTRARRSIHVWADPEILSRCLERRITRASGLRDALWS
jgi:exodeoxyribonuclease V alpha subunit